MGLLAVTTGLLALLVAPGENAAALALAVGEAAWVAWLTAALSVPPRLPPPLLPCRGMGGSVAPRSL